MMLLASAPTRPDSVELSSNNRRYDERFCGTIRWRRHRFNERYRLVTGARATRRGCGEGFVYQSGAGRKADFTASERAGESSDGADGMRSRAMSIKKVALIFDNRVLLTRLGFMSTGARQTDRS